MKCPYCGKRWVYEDGAVMCEWCAEAISTNELFDMFTFGGRIPDELVLPVYFAGPVVMGIVALVSLLMVV